MRFLKRQRLAHVSPWVLAAACGLLALIIGVFAVNNYRRDKVLMTQILVEKGTTLIRFVSSSARSSLFNGLRNGQDILNLWPEYVQQILQHASGHPGLHYLAIVDPEGYIYSCSEPDRCKQEVSPSTKVFIQTLKDDLPESGTFRYRIGKDNGSHVFQVAAKFPPFGRQFLNSVVPRLSSSRHPGQPLQRQPLFHGLNVDLVFQLEELNRQEKIILVELDLARFNKALSRKKLEIVFLSIVLLLVGVGGWISILTLEGLKGSQSRLRKVEEELRRSERLAALGKMAAGVAHELRNPLSSIKGLALLLQSRVSENANDVETADILVQEVERLNRSISELLDYARPEQLQKQDVDLQKLLHKSVSLIRIDAEAAGVTVSEEFPATPLPPVQADADKLTQVFLNLLLNAIQSMEHGGMLTVSAGIKDGFVEIAVTDTGCGIGAENIDRVLDPYFTTKPEGTGLGLAMSAKIVEEHGGSIQILSGEGKGCSVKVQIPR